MRSLAFAIVLLAVVLGSGHAVGATATARLPRTPRGQVLADSLRAGQALRVDSLAQVWLGQLRRERRADPAALADAYALSIRARFSSGGFTKPDTRPALDSLYALALRHPGRDSLRYAEALLLHGKGLLAVRQNALAQRQIDEARRLLEARLPERDTDVMDARYLIVQLAVSVADSATALPLLRRLMTLQTRPDGGADSLAIARLIEQMARVHHLTDRSLDALPLLDQAIGIRSRMMGERHSSLAAPLYFLADVERSLRRPAAARLHAEQALAMHLASFGRRSFYVAGDYGLLAAIEQQLGNAEAALALADSSDSIGTAIGQGRNGRMFTSRVRVAALGDLGRFEEAERIDREMIAFHTEQDGRVSQAIVDALVSLGSHALGRGRPRECLALTQQALALGDSVARLGEYVVLSAELDRAFAHAAVGDGRAGIDAADRALALANRTRHPRAFEAATAHAARARALERAGQDADAFAEALVAERLRRANVLAVLAGGSESDALHFSEQRTSALDLAVWLAAHRAGSPDRIDSVWAEVAQTRGMLLEHSAARARLARLSRDPAVGADLRRLQIARERWAHAWTTFGDSTSTALAESVRVAERALARVAPSLRMDSVATAIPWDRLRSSLAPDAAWVAYWRCTEPVLPPADSVMRSRGEGLPADSGEYLAFVLRPGQPARLVSLGRAADIEQRIEDWRATLRTRPGSAKDLAICRRLGDRVRQVIWDPIAPLLKGVSTLNVVPAGALHSVPFSALPLGSGWFMDRGPMIRVLDRESDGVSVRTGSDSRGAVLAFGDPDFEAVGDTVAHPALASYRGERSTCLDLRAVRFERLPASADEIAAVEQAWPERVQSRLGRAASESAFKQDSPNASVLHLATHAFLLGPASCGRVASGARGIGGLAPTSTTSGSTREPATDSRDPLVRAGVALAGANSRELRSGEAEDGILSAQEIASLPLDGVELVVLSGCETGLGTVAASEGVLGLERAFRVAGVRTVVASLWSVEDRSASLWMSRFHAAHASGQSPLAAAHDAMRDVRARGGLLSHPFHWAAFVVSGP